MAPTVKRDMDIQQDVINELYYDPEVDRTDVGIEVDEGVVTLTGTVKTPLEKWAAERATFRVAGVRAVANEIVVKLVDGGLADDTVLATRVADAFAHNVAIPTGIHIRVAHGTVTLAGAVEWQFQRAAAERLVRGMRGVRAVENHVTIAQPVIAAHEIEAAITQAFARSAAIDAARVQVSVEGRELTLTGTVRSWAEYHAAEEAAWRTKGVIAVTNRIAVEL